MTNEEMKRRMYLICRHVSSALNREILPPIPRVEKGKEFGEVIIFICVALCRL